MYRADKECRNDKRFQCEDAIIMGKHASHPMPQNTVPLSLSAIRPNGWMISSPACPHSTLMQHAARSTRRPGGPPHRRRHDALLCSMEHRHSRA